MRNWLIKILGGKTEYEFIQLRQSCEKFAVEYLQGKKGEVLPDCSIYSPFDGDDILVLKSRTRILNGRIKGLVVAPWCIHIVTGNLIKD